MQASTLELSRQFATQGFIIAPEVFRPEETAVWKEECRRILAAVTAEAEAAGKPRPGFWQSGVYVGLSIRSEVFRAMARDPRLLDLMEALIGPNLLFWSDKVVFKAEEADFDTPWHQDWPYWKGAHKVSAWVALDDVDPSNGCLKLAPGSHTWATAHDGKVAAGQSFGHRVDASHIDESKVVTAAVPAGSAVIFHDLTLHASYPNSSHRDRWAVVSTYKDPLADDLDYPAMTAAAVVRGRGRRGDEARGR